RMAQRKRLVEGAQSLRRVPQQPEGHRSKASAANTQIVANTEHRRTALVWRVACDACLQVLTGSRQHAKVAPRHSEGIVGDNSEGGVVSRLPQAQQRLPEFS